MLREKSMKSGEEKKYSYDSFGRMVRAEVPVESTATREFQVQINRYDGEGLRHEMEENGRLIKFLYNEDREVVAEETGNGTITRYIRGLGIISSDSEEAKTYYHYVSDEQGSITHVLSEDAEILNHYSYDAFGNIIEKTEKVENRFCYNGEMLDPVTQQYYLRARFYNPVIGRFTQEDTYYGDGLNLYQYCQANPVGYVDPSGHNICPTQLSLYKKYKEFFAKKMPEAEAKKKAYEYMRKKMGLTADNPFTEASEGGTKSAYNDRGNTVKNWKGQNAAGAYQSATEKGNSKSGSDSSIMDYSNRFADSFADDFNHGVEVRDVVKEDMILVQFSSDAPNASLRYWTTIDEANGISTIEEYMDKMALSKEWGNRNVVKVARVKKGTEVTHAIGTAKAQTKISDPRPGNGKQILFSKFDSNWITEVRNIKE